MLDLVRKYQTGGGKLLDIAAMVADVKNPRSSEGRRKLEAIKEIADNQAAGNFYSVDDKAKSFKIVDKSGSRLDETEGRGLSTGEKEFALFHSKKVRREVSRLMADASKYYKSDAEVEQKKTTVEPEVKVDNKTTEVKSANDVVKSDKNILLEQQFLNKKLGLKLEENGIADERFHAARELYHTSKANGSLKVSPARTAVSSPKTSNSQPAEVKAAPVAETTTTKEPAKSPYERPKIVVQGTGANTGKLVIPAYKNEFLTLPEVVYDEAAHNKAIALEERKKELLAYHKENSKDAFFKEHNQDVYNKIKKAASFKDLSGLNFTHKGNPRGKAVFGVQLYDKLNVPTTRIHKLEKHEKGGKILKFQAGPGYGAMDYLSKSLQLIPKKSGNYKDASMYIGDKESGLAPGEGVYEPINLRNEEPTLYNLNNINRTKSLINGPDLPIYTNSYKPSIAYVGDKKLNAGEGVVNTTNYPGFVSNLNDQKITPNTKKSRGYTQEGGGITKAGFSTSGNGDLLRLGAMGAQVLLARHLYKNPIQVAGYTTKATQGSIDNVLAARKLFTDNDKRRMLSSTETYKGSDPVMALISSRVGKSMQQEMLGDIVAKENQYSQAEQERVNAGMNIVNQEQAANRNSLITNLNENTARKNAIDNQNAANKQAALSQYLNTLGTVGSELVNGKLSDIQQAKQNEVTDRVNKTAYHAAKVDSAKEDLRDARYYELTHPGTQNIKGYEDAYTQAQAEYDAHIKENNDIALNRGSSFRNIWNKIKNS